MYVLAALGPDRSSNTGRRVLVLHDDGVFCNVVKGILTDAGYSTDVCASTDAALELVDGGNYGVLIAEQRLGHTDVLSLAQQLRATHADLSVVLLVSDKTLELAIGGLQSGFFDFMTRSFDLSALGEHVLDAVARAFDGHVVSSRPGSVPPASSSDTLDGVLIGSSPSIERAREQYRCALHTDAPVVIAGEKGTEKEALARAIHELGSRKGEPFLVVTADHGQLSVQAASQGAGGQSSNGSSSASSNGASHGSSNGSNAGAVPGSSDGASQGSSASLGDAHAWRFVKGTLYFPDANALSLPAQSALVELLSGVASSAGGVEAQSGERPRVIAALEQATEESWAQSTLRRVFERVGGVRIELPSLRERGRDIALLAEHFAEQLRLARGDAYLRITPTALEALARYHWPGNVDELRLAIQHAASLCAQSTIRVADLPPSISLSMDTPTEEHAPRLQVQSLEDMELKYILRVLHAVGGNKASAARLLGVDRTTLYRKLQRQQPLALARTDARPQPQRAVK